MPDNFATFDLVPWTSKMAKIANTTKSRLDIITCTPGSVHITLQITAATSPQEEKAQVIYDRLLALLLANSTLFGDNGITISSVKTSDSPPPPSQVDENNTGSSNVGLIAGLVAAGAVLILVIIILVVFLLRRRSIQQDRKQKRAIAMKTIRISSSYVCLLT
jgi:hypothetical protein